MSEPLGLNGQPRRGAPIPAGGAGLPATRTPPSEDFGWTREPAAEVRNEAFTLIDAWIVLVKRRGLIAFCLAAALALGAAVTLLSPPIYTARTTLQIDREAEKVVSNEDQTPIDNLSEEFFQTQYGLLRSSALMERVTDALGLARGDGFIRAMTGAPPTPAAGGDHRRDTVLTLLRTHQGVTPERGSRLVSISFSSPDAALSAKIANAFAENFITAAIDRRFESSSYARDFLEKRLAQVKARLEQSERDLVAYAASQQIIQLPGGGGGAPNTAEAGPSLAAVNLESFNTALAAARTERIKAEEKWRQARASPGFGLSDILQSPTFQSLSQEHAKLTATYEDKLRIFKPDYPDMTQLKARIDETERQLEMEAANIRQSLRAQYQAALANETALSDQVKTLETSVLDLRGRSIRYTILQREVDTNRTLYDGLLQRYKEVGVAGGVSSNNISIVDRAEPPLMPSSPRPLVNMILAALAGLGLGVAAAFVREAFDQALRTPTDMETELTAPLLGSIPVLKKNQSPRQALADGRSPMAEAYQSLRSALQFSTVDGFPQTLLVTSPWPGGGKTTTAFALSQYVARLGFRVLLIDADLRNPSVGELFGARGGAGLTNLLTGAATLKQVIMSTEFANLYLVVSGPPAPGPVELLSGMRLPRLIAEAASLFDMIIIDGPPVMDLADAPIIGSVVAGCLLVVEAGRTTRGHVRRSMRRLSQAGAHILGAVLTKYRPAHDTQGAGYGYGGAYGYPGTAGQEGGAVGRLLSRARRRLMAK